MEITEIARIIDPRTNKLYVNARIIGINYNSFYLQLCKNRYPNLDVIRCLKGIYVPHDFDITKY